MLAQLYRAMVVLALAPWLVFASAMPQEHLHEVDSDHPQPLVHRHAAPHSLASHDHDGAEVSHDEERVVWLSDASVVESTYHFDVPLAVVGPSFEMIRAVASWIATAPYDASPPHGPPRPYRSPRAPPIASA